MSRKNEEVGENSDDDSNILSAGCLYPRYGFYYLLNIQFYCEKMYKFVAGHFMDQKRLKQGLYRHPWDDISYVLPEQYTN